VTAFLRMCTKKDSSLALVTCTLQTVQAICVVSPVQEINRASSSAASSFFLPSQVIVFQPATQLSSSSSGRCVVFADRTEIR
jgi:hypothetical protein